MIGVPLYIANAHRPPATWGTAGFVYSSTLSPLSACVSFGSGPSTCCFLGCLCYERRVQKVIAVVDTRARAPSPRALLGISEIPWRSSLQQLAKGAAHLKHILQQYSLGLPFSWICSFVLLRWLSQCAGTADVPFSLSWHGPHALGSSPCRMWERTMF